MNSYDDRINELKKYIDYLPSTVFDENYYEDGIKKKISGYENFHWIPTRSYPEAMEIIKRFNFETAIDYGCAKGFLVHALRQLEKKVYGEDISDYAISHSDPKVKSFLSKPTLNRADLIICKDVIEHIEEKEIPKFLDLILFKCKKNALFIIPLGDNDKFRIREYEMDKTHVTKKDEDWWIDKLKLSGFYIDYFDYSMGVIKEKWTSEFKYGNGFFSTSLRK